MRKVKKINKPRTNININLVKQPSRIQLIIGDEVQYDSNGNIIYKDSVNDYLDLINYFKKQLHNSVGIPAHLFNKYEEDSN